MTYSSQKDFNDFLKANSLWICLAVAGLILLIVLISIFVAKGKKKGSAEKPRKRVIDANAYITALGGAENIVSHNLVRSRIILELKDYDLVDKEKLKEAGVDSFIMMSEKLTLVIKGDADKVNQAIFGD